MRRPFLIAVIALAACSKKAAPSGKPGAATPEAAVRGFVEAVVAGDLDRARGFIADDAACAAAPPAHVTPCTENSRAMRDQVGTLVDAYPKGKGKAITSIERSPDAPPSTELGAWTIHFGGADQAGLMTVMIGDRYYAAFSVRRDLPRP